MLKSFNGFTRQNLVFNIDIYQDQKEKVFVAKLSIHSPALAPEKLQGQSVPIMDFKPLGEIRHDDLDKLIQACKDRIVELGGNIRRFEEV